MELEYKELNYKDIGARIKERRLRQKLNQERLAEKVDLSLTHMSHIETGNTKLSLPTLHKISWALKAPMDALACDSTVLAKETFESELLYHTKDCNETELRIIVDMVIAAKASLRKRLPKEISGAGEQNAGFAYFVWL